jgi:hypothetical protein
MEQVELGPTATVSKDRHHIHHHKTSDEDHLYV